MMKDKIPDLENDQNRWISSQLPHSKGVRRGPCLVEKPPENAHKLLFVGLKCGHVAISVEASINFKCEISLLTKPTWKAGS